jgi:hypothetical protein
MDTTTRWVWALGLALVAGLLSYAVPPASAFSAPAGHALPFYGAYAILEGPRSDPERTRRDAEAIIVDLPVRTLVRASNAGEVVFAGWQSPATGYDPSPLGVVLHLRHDDGTLSEYGHLNDADVWVGKWVERGEFIAHSGQTGETDRPALYFAILVGASGVGFDGRSVSLRDLPGLDWEGGIATGAGQVRPARNLARGRPTWASSEESATAQASFAVDGTRETRYSSGHRRQVEELGVALDDWRVVSRVIVHWEAARPQIWSVWAFAPGESGGREWRLVWRTADGGHEATFDAVEALAIMVRSEDHWRQGWANMSIYELEVKGA